jgi:hypothetical protein
MNYIRGDKLMNKRRGFYRRKSNPLARILPMFIIITSLGGYTAYKYKDKIGEIVDIKDVFSITSKDKDDEVFTAEDLGLEDKKADEKEEEKEKVEDKETIKAESSLITINEWKIYSVQVGALTDKTKIKTIQDKLLKDKTPFCIVEDKGVSKIYTYSFVDENSTRKHLENIKGNFTDAFLSTTELPVMSFEYTKKYEYMKAVSEDLNKLISNFEAESKFWSENKAGEFDFEKYKGILDNRKAITESLDKGIKEIDYKDLGKFKDSLELYNKSLKETIDSSLKSNDATKTYINQSLFISSMFGYFTFINSIQ